MMTTDKYLAHCYPIPETQPVLPLADEAFVAAWKEAKGKVAQELLADIVNRAVDTVSLKNEKAFRVFFADTLGGRLPVIVTGDREDFLHMEAALNGQKEVDDIPDTVNAFAMQVQADKTAGCRLLLLGRAPYSNVPAQSLGLDEEEWLERSHHLRLAHECAHYETLRLFGNMKNHALDEIVADAMGQLTAFGDFRADRQRLFFGLEQGTGRCTGRLSFYCRNVLPWERAVVYRSVDAMLSVLEDEINGFLAGKKMLSKNGRASSVKALLTDKAIKYELLAALAGTSIAERINQSLLK